MKNRELENTNVRLMDTIKELTKTIDKLSDKLLAVQNLPAYSAYKDEPGERTKPEKEIYKDPDTVSAEQALNPPEIE